MTEVRPTPAETRVQAPKPEIVKPENKLANAFDSLHKSVDTAVDRLFGKKTDMATLVGGAAHLTLARASEGAAAIADKLGIGESGTEAQYDKAFKARWAEGDEKKTETFLNNWEKIRPIAETVKTEKAALEKRRKEAFGKTPQGVLAEVMLRLGDEKPGETVRGAVMHIEPNGMRMDSNTNNATGGPRLDYLADLIDRASQERNSANPLDRAKGALEAAMAINAATALREKQLAEMQTAKALRESGDDSEKAMLASRLITQAEEVVSAEHQYRKIGTNINEGFVRRVRQETVDTIQIKGDKKLQQPDTALLEKRQKYLLDEKKKDPSLDLNQFPSYRIFDAFKRSISVLEMTTQGARADKASELRLELQKQAYTAILSAPSEMWMTEGARAFAIANKALEQKIQMMGVASTSPAEAARTELGQFAVKPA